MSTVCNAHCSPSPGLTLEHEHATPRHPTSQASSAPLRFTLHCCGSLCIVSRSPTRTYGQQTLDPILADLVRCRGQLHRQSQPESREECIHGCSRCSAFPKKQAPASDKRMEKSKRAKHTEQRLKHTLLLPGSYRRGTRHWHCTRRCR